MNHESQLFFSQYPQLQEPEILELQNAFGPETLAAWKPVNLPPTQPPLRNQGFYQGLLKGNPWVIRGGDMLGGNRLTSHEKWEHVTVNDGLLFR